MKKQFKLIGFDLDGTLVDSLPDLTLSLNQVFEEMHFPQISNAQVLPWIGQGVEVFMQHALDWINQTQSLSVDDATHLQQRFEYFYGQNICSEGKLFPQVKETLDLLYAKGYTLAVVTNKPTKLVQPVLEALGIFHLFAQTLGGQSLPAIKPHPAPLYYLCGQFGCYPNEILFVGDSRNDIIAAKAAGCPCVGLTYGYNYNIPIADSNPDYVFDDFSQILTIVT